MTTYVRCATGWAGLLLLAGPGLAEIQSIRGSAQASVQEFRGGLARDSDLAFDSFPDLAPFPVQVLARLKAIEPGYLAAAAVAAQFADPTELDQPNPEEFAVNLALNSEQGDVRYDASVILLETRDIVFNPGEISPESAAGDETQLIGKLFIDGALAIVAPEATVDLTGQSVLLRVRVTRLAAGQEQTVYSGAVELRGEPAGQVGVGAEGAFPVNQLILSDLGGVVGQPSLFRLLVMPNLEINYAYAATIGEPFQLTARLEIEASNVPGAGVAAVIGSATNALDLVLQLTQGVDQARKLTSALALERAAPTGQPAFAADAALPLPLCGVLGVGPMGLLLAGLCGVRSARWAHTLLCGGPRTH